MMEPSSLLLSWAFQGMYVDMLARHSVHSSGPLSAPEAIASLCNTSAALENVRRRAEEMLHVPRAQEARIQVLKRFTGGGTVVVDSNTVFATLIFQVSMRACLSCKSKDAK